jgi:Tol biopolymer transport system component
VWADRQGPTQPLALPPAAYHEVRISPDGTRVSMLEGASGSGDVWIYDLTRKTNTRLTFTGTNAAPVWSADGNSIFYTSLDPTGRKSTVMRKPADGSDEAQVITSVGARAYVAWVSRDATSSLLEYMNLGAGMADILRLPMRSGAEPASFVSSPSDEYGASVSADGRWLAYHADDTGRFEVYVRELSGSGGRWQVSNAGGEEPHWSPDGREIYYRSVNRLMVTGAETRPTFQVSTPRVLFEGVYDLRSESGRSYDVDPKTGRFLMIRPAATDTSPAVVRTVVNWLDELKSKLEGGR